MSGTAGALCERTESRRAVRRGSSVQQTGTAVAFGRRCARQGSHAARILAAVSARGSSFLGRPAPSGTVSSGRRAPLSSVPTVVSGTVGIASGTVEYRTEIFLFLS